jgi:hypothetical protein
MISARILRMRVGGRGGIPPTYHGTFHYIERGILIVFVCSDPNCGAAYDAAVDDTLLGVAYGCSQSNPSNAVSKPAGSPSCV